MSASKRETRVSRRGSLVPKLCFECLPVSKESPSARVRSGSFAELRPQAELGNEAAQAKRARPAGVRRDFNSLRTRRPLWPEA
jgi:hypothetical protein